LPFASVPRCSPPFAHVHPWIVCLGRRTISRVWETTGRATSEGPTPPLSACSNQAAWNWDELCRILLLLLLTALVPGTTLWLVTDDTLCHKRGAKGGFPAGIFLDAVLSTKRHRSSASAPTGHLGLWVQCPVAREPLLLACRFQGLWRVYAKKDG